MQCPRDQADAAKHIGETHRNVAKRSEGKFLPAGRAWQMCRDGEADPEKFGILGMSGRWFVRGNVVRDLLALNKLEVSPWDTWRLATKDDEALTDAHLVLCDRVAALTQGDDVDLAEIRAIYETAEDVHLPPWLG